MTIDKRVREHLLAYCGQLHDDDGVDPRQFFRKEKDRTQQNHKAEQLCKQVAETLSLVLAGEFSDDRLHGLQVEKVEPAPNASQLSVTFRTDTVCSCLETEAILLQINRVAGQLRSAVAAAITRKRTPKLTFRVVGPSEEVDA